jgi:hypothetical protein
VEEISSNGRWSESIRQFWRRHVLLRILISVLLFASSVAILGWQLYRGRDVLLSYDWHVHWGAALMAFAFYTLAIFVATWVWAGIMNGLGGRLPIWSHFHYLCLTNLAKRLPGTIWYVVGRSQLYARHKVPAQTTSVASAIELGVSSVAGVVVNLVFSVPIMGHYGLSAWWLIIVAVLGLLLVQPALIAWLLRRLGVPAERLSYRRMLSWVAAHGLVWLLGGCMLFSIANIFTPVDLSHLPYVIGSWSLVGVVSVLLFFSPSNIGITEVGLSILLSAILPGPFAVIVALFVRITTIAFEIVWALASIVIFGWPSRRPVASLV